MGPKKSPPWTTEWKRAEDAWIGVLAPSLARWVASLTVPQFIHLGVSEVSKAASVKRECVVLDIGEILV